MKKETQEVIKTKLSNKERVVYFVVASIFSVLVSFVLKFLGDSKPFIDGFATVFSILGQLLTVKRCIEQWYVWFFVNLLSLIMWVFAYINGSNCFATIIMWAVYLVLSIYFLQAWKKEINVK